MTPENFSKRENEQKTKITQMISLTNIFNTKANLVNTQVKKIAKKGRVE